MLRRILPAPFKKKLRLVKILGSKKHARPIQFTLTKPLPAHCNIRRVWP